jgi:hypothetical protein
MAGGQVSGMEEVEVEGETEGRRLTRCKFPLTRSLPMAVLLKSLLGLPYFSRIAAYEGIMSGSCSSFSGVGRGLACVSETRMPRSRLSTTNKFIVESVAMIGIRE